MNRRSVFLLLVAMLGQVSLEALKLLANKRDVPYQSLIKVYLSERILRELTDQDAA